MSEKVGRVWRLGDQVDTDALAPGKYMKLSIAEQVKHCLETLRPEFASDVRPGDVIVAGDGLGIGSSREQAAQVLVELGVQAIIARSAARIFYRNAINLGLPVLIGSRLDSLQDGTRVTVDLGTGRVCNEQGEAIAMCEPMPEFLQQLIADGGLLPNLKRRIASGEVRPRALP
jgi:3-isopropylmalate/(R)-2-methylmalate dehydratase small subunit